MGNYAFKNKINLDDWVPSDVPSKKYILQISNTLMSIVHVDMTNRCKLIGKNNLMLGSVVNSVVSLFEFYDREIILSRSFVNYNVLKNYGESINIDNCVRVMNEFGVCSESVFPCTCVGEIPSDYCFGEAKKYYKYVDVYELYQDLEQLKQCLFNGNPFVCGINIYDNFCVGDVVIPMPNFSGSVAGVRGQNRLGSLPGECEIAKGNLVGSMMIMVVGFNDMERRFVFKSSSAVVRDGFGWIPYDYIINSQHAGDFRFINSITPNVYMEDSEESEEFDPNCIAQRPVLEEEVYSEDEEV